MTTAMVETTTVIASVFHPTRPRLLRSPISATPTTMAEKSRGSTSMKSRPRKSWPIVPVTLSVTHCTHGVSAPI
jgi:hypothetical protein